nr:exonuclease SbcCD subunit D [Paenibacillus turpanensis]
MHTADWHFGKMLEGRSRLPEQELFIDELERIVREERIDLILMAGDVYDSVNPPAAAEQLFYDALNRLSDGGKVPIAAIAGNHDHPDRLAASAPLAAKQAITLLGLPVKEAVTIPVRRTGEQAVLYGLPYPSEARLNELLELEADERKLQQAYSERIARLVAGGASGFRTDTVNLVMSHVFAKGGKETPDSERPIQVGGAYTVDSAALCGVLGASGQEEDGGEDAGGQAGLFSPASSLLLPQYVALGHLHRAQTLSAPSLVRYSGSPIAYSFSEAGHAKSVSIVEVSLGGSPLVTEIPLSSGRPLVNWKAKGGIAEVYGWLEEGRDANAWIELDVMMTEALTMEHIHNLRKAHPGITVIRPVYPDKEETGSFGVDRERLSVDEMFRRFYVRQTGGAEPEQELVQLFMELLQHDQNDDEEAAG